MNFQEAISEHLKIIGEKSNPCHKPAGPGGGQFCSGTPGGGSSVGVVSQILSNPSKGSTPPPKPKTEVAKVGGGSAADLVKPSFAFDTGSSQDEVTKTLEAIPAWHLGDTGGGKSRLRKLEVKKQKDVTAEWSKRNNIQKSGIQGFANITDGKDAGRIVIASNSVEGTRITLAHEISHLVFDSSLKVKPSQKANQIKDVGDKLEKLYNSRGKTLAVTEYAKTSFREFRAEVYGYYVGKPSLLKKRDPEAYEIVKELFK